VDRLEAAANALVDGLLPQPAIATGSYVPPLTRVGGIGDTDGTGHIAQALDRMASDRNEDISNIRDDLRAILSAILGIDLSIDGASLERTLDTLRRDRVRAFGGA